MRLNIASTSPNTIKVLPLTKQLPILTTDYPIINRFCKHYFFISVPSGLKAVFLLVFAEASQAVVKGRGPYRSWIEEEGLLGKAVLPEVRKRIKFHPN